MHEKHIACESCDKIYPLTTKVFRCSCGGSVEVIFDYKKMRSLSFKGRPFNHSRYTELYPGKNLISLGEGGTPLISSKQDEAVNVLFKNEAVNPSGSFKDRGSAVEISKALEFKTKKVICASTGNMGASVAAYAARAGLSCNIIVPQDAQQNKLHQILTHGARVYQINDDYDYAANVAQKISQTKGHFLLGDYLYRREGTKSVGFELAEQVEADYVFVPVGNGTLLSAIWKAYTEFKLLKKIRSLPRLVSVQAQESSTVSDALMKGTKLKNLLHPHSIATAIEVGVPLDGKRTLNAIKASKGFACEVSDQEILKARERLAQKEGLYSEPAGAAAYAGFLKVKDSLPKKSTVVCLVTGHGLKTSLRGGKVIKIRRSTIQKIQ